MPPIFASFSSSIKSYGLIRPLTGGIGLQTFYRVFANTGTFTVPANVTTIDYLIVAGGGSGGQDGGGRDVACGGGGAGGVLTGASYPVTPGQTFTITVGAGGSNYGAEIGRAHV